MVMGDDEHDDEDGAEEEPSVFEQAADEFTEMAIEDGTLPDGDDIEENIEWTTAQMEYAHEEEQIQEDIAAEEARFDEMEREDAENGHDDEYEDEPEDGFDPNEENWEAEDMPGDNADEREEAYDNHDWDAADG